MSESVRKNPIGFPKAISPIVSAVKYCTFCARLNAFVSVGAERYDSSSNFMSAAMFASIFSSRSTISRPEYCQEAAASEQARSSPTPSIKF